MRKVSALFLAAFVASGLAVVEAAAATPMCNGKRATIQGTAGRDRLRGTTRADVIVAKGGADRIDALSGNDTICAAGGNDRIIGGTGDDWIDAGEGTDTGSWETSNRVAIRLDAGITQGTENDPALLNLENVIGTPGRDNIYGNDGPNRLVGGGGNDAIFGGGGNDALLGGDGMDGLWGDDGDDALFGDAGDDRLYGAAGTDTTYGGAGTDACVEQEADVACEIFTAGGQVTPSQVTQQPSSGTVDFGRTFEAIEQVCFRFFLDGDLFDAGEEFFIRLDGPSGGAFGSINSTGPSTNLIVSCLVWPGHEEVNRFLDGQQAFTVSMGDGSPPGSSVHVTKFEIEITTPEEGGG